MDDNSLYIYAFFTTVIVSYIVLRLPYVKILESKDALKLQDVIKNMKTGDKQTGNLDQLSNALLKQSR